MSKEAVNHPSHYNTGKYEVIDVIEDWDLGFNDGNAIKYIARHKHKGKPLEDLKKAKWYIERLIQQYEDAAVVRKPTPEGPSRYDYKNPPDSALRFPTLKAAAKAASEYSHPVQVWEDKEERCWKISC